MRLGGRLVPPRGEGLRRDLVDRGPLAAIVRLARKAVGYKLAHRNALIENGGTGGSGEKHRERGGDLVAVKHYARTDLLGELMHGAGVALGRRGLGFGHGAGNGVEHAGKRIHALLRIDPRVCEDGAGGVRVIDQRGDNGGAGSGVGGGSHGGPLLFRGECTPLGCFGLPRNN